MLTLVCNAVACNTIASAAVADISTKLNVAKIFSTTCGQQQTNMPNVKSHAWQVCRYPA